MTDLSFDDLIPENADSGVQPNRDSGISFDDLIPADQTNQPSAMADAADQFGRGFNRGLYQTINLPTGLANLVLGGADYVAEQMGGDVDFRFKRPLEVAAPGADRSIMEIPEAQTSAGRVAQKVGEFTGANALPAGGTLAAAPRLAAATANATTTGGRVVNSIAQPIANAPGTAAAGEVLSSVGSGLGASVAESIAPGSSTAEFFGSLAGGVALPAAVAVAPTNLVRKGVRAAKGAKDEASRRGRQAISDRLSDEMTPEVEASIRETQKIQDSVPGYNPSLAEATETPDLIATQRHIEGGYSGAQLNKAAQRYTDNDRAISLAADDLQPKSNITLEDLFDGAADRVQRVRKKIDAAKARLDQKEQSVAAGLQSGSSKKALGASVREELIDARAQMKEEMGIVAGELGLNDTRARFDFSGAKDRLKAAAKPRSSLSDKNKIPANILNDIDNAPDQVSIVDLMELRSRISTDIRIAQRTPQQEGKVPYLQSLKQELDLVTDDLLRTVDDGELADDLSKFRDMYRVDYIEPFEQGAAGRVLGKDVDGVFRVPDERVIKEYFDGWNETAATQFNKTFKDSPRANAAMESAALDDLFDFSVRDGQIDFTRVKVWRAKNKPVLKSFPGIDRKIQEVSSTLDAVSKRRADLLEREAVVNRSYLAKELSKIDNPVTNAGPEAIVDAAIDRNPARMKRLMSSVKSPEAQKAVAGYVWNKALDSGNPLEYITKNRASIKTALGDRFEAAEQLAKAIRKNRLVPRPSGQAIDANPMATVEDFLGTGLNQISSRVFAVNSGRTSARYAAADILGRAFRKATGNNAYRALEQAIYDPEIAMTLANAMQFKTMNEKKAKRLFTYLVSNGMVAFGEDSGGAPSQ